MIFSLQLFAGLALFVVDFNVTDSVLIIDYRVGELLFLTATFLFFSTFRLALLAKGFMLYTSDALPEGTDEMVPVPF